MVAGSTDGDAARVVNVGRDRITLCKARIAAIEYEFGNDIPLVVSFGGSGVIFVSDPDRCMSGVIGSIRLHANAQRSEKRGTTGSDRAGFDFAEERSGNFVVDFDTVVSIVTDPDAMIIYCNAPSALFVYVPGESCNDLVLLAVDPR